MNPPNIVFIVLDTARAENFPMYGYDRDTTPNLEKLAAEGTVYDNAISPSPWSLPSHASMLTGKLPSNHETYAENQHLDSEDQLLTTQLREEGYTTYGISSNSWVSPEFGFGTGFDSFTSTWKLFETEIDSRTLSDASIRERIRTYLDGEALKSILNVLYRQVYFKKYDYGALRVNYEAKRTLATAKEPFFLFLNYMEPHLEYGPPKFTEEFVSGQTDIDQDPWSHIFDVEPKTEQDFKTLQELYDAELKYVDWRVGKLLNRLKEENQYDDSLIIVTSDHGENIGEHDLMDHQYCLYNTLLHVPLIVKYPNKLQKEISDRITTPVSTLDLFPTVCSVCDIDVENSIDGDILPQRTEDENRYVISEYLSPMPSVEDIVEQYSDLEAADVSWINRTIRSVQNKHMKYIQYEDSESEYFNLEIDSQEEQNIVEQIPTQKIQKLQNIIDNKTTDDFGSGTRDISQETQDILSDLGYLN